MHHDFSKLLQRPGCCGVGGDVEVSDPASSDFQKNEQPSSQPPLLGASPLRTGLESFPSSGSSIPERPHEKRGRGCIQQQMNTTYSILICGQLARQWGKPPTCGKLHQQLAPPSFALLPASVPQRFSSWNTIAKSAPFPARSCCPIDATRPLSARLQGSIRFLAIPIPAPPSIHLTVDLPLAGSDTGLPCSTDMTH